MFAEMKGPVVDVLRQYGMTDRFTPDRFAPTVGAAVDELTGSIRGDLEGTKWDDDARRTAGRRSARAVTRRLGDSAAQRRVRASRSASSARRCVVRLELGVPGAVGVTIAAALLAVVAATPLDRHGDREDERRDLADRPGDAAAGVLVLERGRTPGAAHRAEPLGDHEARLHHDRDAEERVHRHDADEQQQPAGVGQAVGHRVDADERQHEEVAR